jgi:hypothetical protein
MMSIAEPPVGDPAPRCQFCECFLNTVHNNDTILNKTFLLMKLGFIRQDMLTQNIRRKSTFGR